MLEKIERDLARDGEEARDELDDAFGRFERAQPLLAEHVGEVLSHPLDETALALGYFLSISIWLAFERTFPGRLREVDGDALEATEAAIVLEEELHQQRSREPFDAEEILRSAQPRLFAFVHEHVTVALEMVPRRSAPHGVDIRDVELVRRSVVVLTLALSHAVRSVPGQRGSDPPEMLA